MEIWKDIKDYEGLYQASNLGNIKSVKKNRNLKFINRSDGYYYINLSKKSKVKPTKVHRIIAQTFIENPNNYNIINHIDGNRKNNCISNLEWCTQSHNIKEAYRMGTKKPNKINIKKRKKVMQFSVNYQLIKIWDSIKEASKELKIKDSNISLVCKNKRNLAGGFVWKYKEI